MILCKFSELTLKEMYGEISVVNLHLHTGGTLFQSLPKLLTGFVFNNPGFISLATLVNSQLVCLQPVGDLINRVHFKIMFVSVVICGPR